MKKIIISANNICVDFPTFASSDRSVKKAILKTAIGGSLNVRNHKTYVRAIDNQSFEILDGDRIGIVGHNGSGKTTLLRVIAGVYKPTSGNIVVEGSIVSLIDVAMGMDSEATGLQNIYIKGLLLGLSIKEIKNHKENIIEFSELGDYIHFPVRTYSSGMLLRLAFSIISIMNPSIIIMDEWLSVGDDNFQKKVSIKLKEMVETSSVLILASHSLNVIRENCNRCFKLSGGKLVELSMDNLEF
jgi:lipopolysaccharide transport system ATP-binding protein